MNLTSFNPQQQEAIEYEGGPLLILAGAGSGKTSVLTHRIAHLVTKRKVPPHNILAVTFTNKAAGEMRERLERILGPRAKDLWLGTFHSLGLRILRNVGYRIGLDPNFIVYDEDDQLALVKLCMSELSIDEKTFNPRAILHHIDQAKNSGISPKEYRANITDIFREAVALVYELYQKRLRDNNALDFGDLILEPLRLFREAPSVLKEYQTRFCHILVDEYQDTNRTQYLLINYLAARHKDLCVVGDPDQSIYGWRGADINNILDFERDYPDANVIRLEENYRSTKNILRAANSLIEKNIERKEKTLWTNNPDGEPVSFFMARDEHAEAHIVTGQIKEMVFQEGRSYREFAIFYRTNAQSRVFEEYFLQHGIPYTIVGGLRFYDRKEIKDSLAYLRVLSNPGDSLSLFRIINIPPRGMGKSTLGKVSSIAGEENIPLFDALKVVFDRGVIPRTKGGDFVALIERYKGLIGSMPLHKLARGLLEDSGYIRMWEDEGTEEGESRVENIHELISAIKEFETTREDITLRDFLDQVALISDIDTYEDKHNRVTLMTLHSAKGLEFLVVFIVGIEEGLFPHTRSLNGERFDELEEERRLCYVGMTRAMERLFLLSAMERTIYGYTRTQTPSRFLKEIEGKPRTLTAGH
ncbi:MAG: UvrD-helicase domain-containing protein [Deltaproteobacteria bacterium]|nr:UvrD-helicase domain-containing protein [Deltaproteobacteria bacterium]